MRKFKQGKYEIFEDGTVLNSDTGKALKKSVQRSGYLTVNLDGKTHYLHRLVWTGFNGLVPKGTKIYLRDGVKSNCSLSNLTLDKDDKAEVNHRVVQKTLNDNKEEAGRVEAMMHERIDLKADVEHLFVRFLYGSEHVDEHEAFEKLEKLNRVTRELKALGW